MKKHNSCPQKQLKHNLNCLSYSNKESTLIQRYQHSVVILYNNRIKTFSGVEIKTDCSFIDLSLNNLSDFTNFPQTLIHLTTLILDTNQIGSFKGIQTPNSFPKLRFLSLRKNPIARYSNFKIMCLIVFGSQLHTINGEKVSDIQRQSANKIRKTAFSELVQGKIIKNLQPLRIRDISPQKNINCDVIPSALRSNSFTPRTSNIKTVKFSKTNSDQKRIEKVIKQNKLNEIESIIKSEKSDNDVFNQEGLKKENDDNNEPIEKEEQNEQKSDNFQNNDKEELKTVKYEDNESIEEEKPNELKSDSNQKVDNEINSIKSDSDQNVNNEINSIKSDSNQNDNKEVNSIKSDSNQRTNDKLSIMKSNTTQKVNDVLSVLKSDNADKEEELAHEDGNEQRELEKTENEEFQLEEEKMPESQNQKKNEIKLTVNIIDEPSVNREVQMSLEYPEACQVLILDDETY